MRAALLLPLALLVFGIYAAEQPIPYSHRKHVALGLECTACHTTPGKGEAATFPNEAKCMQCHTAVKKESPAIQLPRTRKSNCFIRLHDERKRWQKQPCV